MKSKLGLIVLEDLCEQIIDSEHKTAPTQSFGIPYVRTPNVKDSRLILDDALRVSEETYQEWTKRSIPQPYDIILCREAPVGDSGMVLPNQKVCLGQRTVLIRPNKEKIYPKYLLFLLNSPKTKHEILSNSCGTHVDHLNMRDIRDLKIEIIHSYDEQKVIGNLLFNLNSQIFLLENQNKVLQQIINGIFKSWFVDFDGVTEFEDSEMGKIPKGWEIIPLNEILNIQIGGDWGEEESFSDSIQVTCLRGTDFEDLNKDGYSSRAPTRWIKKISLEKRTLTDKDILLATSGIGPIGKTVYVHNKINSLYKTDLMYTNFSKCLRAKSKEIAIYVQKILEYWYESDLLSQYVTGTSIPNFDTSSLLQSKIILPPKKLLEEFTKISNLYFETLFNKEKIVLNSLRGYLLPKLMSGEVRV